MSEIIHTKKVDELIEGPAEGKDFGWKFQFDPKVLVTHHNREVPDVLIPEKVELSNRGEFENIYFLLPEMRRITCESCS